MSGSDSISQRKLKYRELLESINALSNSKPGNEEIQKTKSVVKAADKLINEGNVKERVEHPGESLLDSRVLLASSNITSRCIESMSGNSNAYDSNEFTELIKTSSKILQNISLVFEVPKYMYMLGTFSPGPPLEKLKKSRKHVEKQKISHLSQPENLSCIEKTEEGSEMVSQVHKCISKIYKTNSLKPINFIELILDPDDFGRTVENIYNVSFLVRDGLVALSINKVDGLPYIVPVSKKDKENQANKPILENEQFIFSLEMQEWQEAVEAFNVKKPLIIIKSRTNQG